MLVAILAIPLVAAATAAFVRRERIMEAATVLGSAVVFALSLAVAAGVAVHRGVSAMGMWLYADAVSAIALGVIAFVALTAAVYSVGYMRTNVSEIRGSGERTRELSRYYALFNLFVFSMLVVPLSNSLGILWVAIEGTTLASLFLVAYYRTAEALEAAWKYVIVGSVGIALALFGTILTYYAAVQVLGTSYDLTWSQLAPVGGRLDVGVMRLAFVFIIIGYGTKAGLAPMHTWLPDAHSEAPNPVSALLSGVLLNTAMYAILRYLALAGVALGASFERGLLLGFGLLSLTIATAFIWKQTNLKRLLAYSSIEHMGIVLIGIAFGGVLGVSGALLQMISHALTKSTMFFASGRLALAYGTKDVDRITGALRATPVTAIILLIGTFSLIGSPPFGIFTSELTIFTAGFRGGASWASVAMLALVALVFVRLLLPVTSMVFGTPLRSMLPHARDRGAVAAMTLSLAIVLLLGFCVPSPLRGLLEQSTHILGAG